MLGPDKTGTGRLDGRWRGAYETDCPVGEAAAVSGLGLGDMPDPGQRGGAVCALVLCIALFLVASAGRKLKQL